MEVKPITNDDELDQAVAEINALWPVSGAPKPGTAKANRLEVLAILVDDYERKHHPILPPDPIEAIKFRMEQLGWTRRELEPIIGTRSRVSEVLSGRRSLTLAMIRRLRDALDISADVLIGRAEQQAK